MRVTPYYCHDCRVMFTIYWTPTRRKIYCPKCGDMIGVRINPYTTGKNPETQGTKPRWTDEEKDKLKLLYNTTSMTYVEIGKELGKTRKAIARMVERLKL